MEHTEHRAVIVEQGELIASLPESSLDRPVAACPGWTVERLVGHLGRVHTWAASFLAAGPDGTDAVSAGERPPSGGAVLPWYRASLDGLLAELDRHEPNSPAATFDGPGTAAFWFRRQAHELTVHRWDGQDAIDPGRAEPIEVGVAIDGIDEWLDLFVPRFLARREEPLPDDLIGASVHMHCTDEGPDGQGEWLLRITSTGVEVERAHAKGDAALRGPASDLLLVVWHRLALDRIDVVGDSALAEEVLDLVHVT